MSDEGARRLRWCEREEDATGIAREAERVIGRERSTEQQKRLSQSEAETRRGATAATSVHVTTSGPALPRLGAAGARSPLATAQLVRREGKPIPAMLSALRLTANITRPWSAASLLNRAAVPNLFRSATSSSPFAFSRSFHPSLPAATTLNQATRRKPKKKIQASKSPLLEGNTHKKGVVSQIFIAKPKKPNSAKRKVARVKLSTGKTVQAYVPGEGHNLQEHSVVLIRGGRAQDLPGVRCVVRASRSSRSELSYGIGTKSSVGPWTSAGWWAEFLRAANTEVRPFTTVCTFMNSNLPSSKTS